MAQYLNASKRTAKFEWIKIGFTARGATNKTHYTACAKFYWCKDLGGWVQKSKRCVHTVDKVSHIFRILFVSFSSNPTVVRSGSTLTTSSTSTSASVSTISTDYDQSETASIPEVPNRRRNESKTERPASWVAKLLRPSRQDSNHSPQPRRKTFDVSGNWTR